MLSPVTAPLPVSAPPSAPGAVVPEGSGASAHRPGWFGWVLPVLTVALLASLYLVFVRTGRGQWVDERALKGALRFLWADPTRKTQLSLLDQLPLAVGLLGALGVLVSAFVRRQLLVPMIAAGGGLLAMIATQWLKHELLSRPNLGLSEATMNSFPSGHTTAAGAAMLALVLAAPRRGRPVIVVVASLLAALAGTSTIVMGWHRPSDVLGAVMVVAFVGFPTAWLIGLRERSLARSRAAQGLTPRGMDALPGRTTGRLVWVWVGLGAALALVATVQLLPWLLSPLSDEAPDAATFYGLGLLLCLGVTPAAFGMVERCASRWPTRA